MGFRSAAFRFRFRFRSAAFRFRSVNPKRQSAGYITKATMAVTMAEATMAEATPTSKDKEIFRFLLFHHFENY